MAMLFVVHKSRFKKMVSLVRDDKGREAKETFLRIAAAGDCVEIAGKEMSASFPATIYEEGVIFIPTTYFRRLLRATPVKEDFLTFQVNEEGIRFADVHWEAGGSVLFPDPSKAPQSWPPDKPKVEASNPPKNPTLFDFDK
ncbi:MAG: hypothetical protein ABSH16_00365 [Sedimentisphaerales bacterium]